MDKRRNSNTQGVDRIVWLAVGLFGLALVGGLFNPAHASPIACGAVLGPGGTFTLDSDVGPCPGPGAAITVDSAALNMAGFTVSCSSAVAGIAVTGTGAVVGHGTVTNCPAGFLVTSSNSLLILTHASNNNGHGYDIGGDNNKLLRNNGRSNSGSAFSVTGLKNVLIANHATSNGDKGFDVLGSGNTLIKNFASENDDEGFHTAQGNNTLAENTAESNGNNGFDIESNNNRLLKNTAIGNGSSGIVVSEGFTSNVIRQNTTEGNNARDIGSSDLRDENGECASNRWRRNTFSTKDPDCIQ
jgi:parallel beta-helix repeat protein